ncbi:regulatory protein RecX [Microbacterium sediminis]|uniref:Regulatory protein RecX n=1 Tax=Microbacterium sediminis TaxID=904291 RepID=A0A1B9NB48_9MICO|nr:regulatory protein RecX [Microbacterium sediminis]OCG73838.1 hypothetical protein A7J15_06355 [Microbacterium sediminis]QBR74584.1 regulatory protein RecX [Microbacterium sediminis]
MTGTERPPRAGASDGHDGGEHIAPVIPLFGPGGSRPSRRGDEPAATGDGAAPVSGDGPAPNGPRAGAEAPGQETPAAESWHTTWRDLAPERTGPAPAPALTTVNRGGVRFVELAEGPGAPDESGADAADVAARAERRLLRSLGSRGLSVSEARTKLRQQEVPAELVDDIIDRLLRTGALDDARLAEQLVHSATARKKQGRRAIAQALVARGIAREVADAALAELPDDDADRALEFARSKAGQLARFDDDTALRRLVGQLARRGFGGSLAMSAARRALDESRRPSGGVRFE